MALWMEWGGRQGYWCWCADSSQWFALMPVCLWTPGYLRSQGVRQPQGGPRPFLYHQPHLKAWYSAARLIVVRYCPAKIERTSGLWTIEQFHLSFVNDWIDKIIPETLSIPGGGGTDTGSERAKFKLVVVDCSPNASSEVTAVTERVVVWVNLPIFCVTKFGTKSALSSSSSATCKGN